MKKILLILILSLFYTSAYAVSYAVCENIKNSKDIVVLAIDNENKKIYWDNKKIYNIEKKRVWGTGDEGVPRLGDIFAVSPNGMGYVAINRFTYKALINDINEIFGSGNYSCNKIHKKDMLF